MASGLMQFLDAARAEMATLESQLQSDSRFQRLLALRSLVEMYNALSEVGVTLDGMAVAKKPPNMLNGAPKRKQTSEARVKALAIAREQCSSTREPVTTSALYDIISRNGVVIRGENPKNNLSAMLYNAPDFESHGRKGWTLKTSARISVVPKGGASVNGSTEAHQN